jgi:hypothetical protein
MTSLTNSYGKLITYTNEFIETILLQLNSSNNYYTTGDDEIIFIKIGSSKVLILDYTYYINRNIFQTYSINENLLNPFGLEFVLNNTSNEYTLQSVYTTNSHIGTITELQDIYLALYDTNTNPHSYTGSENIDITDNQISLTFPLKINDEIIMHPRNYGALFQLYSGTDNLTIHQNTFHGGQPIATFFSQDKSTTFYGDIIAPNIYDYITIDSMFNNMSSDIYDKTYIDNLISNYYDKTYIDNLDDELNTILINTYTKQEIDDNYYDSTYINTQLDTKANVEVTYTKTEVDNLFTNLDLTDIFYIKEVIDTKVNLKQDNLIDKGGTYSLIYNDKYIQGLIAGNGITLSNPLDADDLNKKNIIISANIPNDYYTKTYIDTNYYDRTTMDAMIMPEPDLSAYMTAADIQTNYYNKLTIDSMIIDGYTRTESDNKFVNKNGDSVIFGDINLEVLTSQRINITNSSTSGWFLGVYESTPNEVGCLFQYKTSASSTSWWQGVWGANTNEFNIWHNYKGLSIKSDGRATINGDLEVGVGAAQGSVKAHFNHVSSTGYMELNGRYRDQGFLNFKSSYHYCELFLTTNSTQGVKSYMRLSDYNNNPYLQTFYPLNQSSDDRLKENEEFIENACETLSKLRPQIYDRKPDMENEDETTWYKESGLIAQEVYYDAPELRHLVRRGKAQTDEEGNEMPLPEIPASIDPSQDPDYSSWGEEAASLNYIGLIAYLVKANNELHDRVKALEILTQPAMES